MVSLYPSDPDCHLWQECDPAALYLSAYLLCSPHIRLALLVNQDNLPCSLIMSIRARMCTIQTFQKAVSGDVGLEAGDVCLAAAGELAI